MRQIALTALGWFIFSLVVPSIWERAMSSAPEWVYRVVVCAVAVAALGLIVFSDPVYERLSRPATHPVVSTVLIVVLGGALLGSLWWAMVVAPQQGSQRAPTPAEREAAYRAGAYGGWTLHKRMDVWTLTPLFAIDRIDSNIASHLDRSETRVPTLPHNLVTDAEIVWRDIRWTVPQPDRSIPPQELVEHITMVRQLGGTSTLEWSYEVIRDGQAVALPQNREVVNRGSRLQPPAVGMALENIENLAASTVSERYIAALRQLGK